MGVGVVVVVVVGGGAAADDGMGASSAVGAGVGSVDFVVVEDAARCFLFKTKRKPAKMATEVNARTQMTTIAAMPPEGEVNAVVEVGVGVGTTVGVSISPGVSSAGTSPISNVDSGERTNCWRTGSDCKRSRVMSWSKFSRT